MKAIVATGPNTLEMQELPLPEPGSGQVRIRTGACGICVTDLEIIAGWERTDFPVIPGHEWSGTIDATGPGVDTSLLGKKSVAENVLKDGGEVGFEHPGGYGEYFLTEAENLRLLPDDFSLVTGALIEPLAVCARAVSRLGSDAGDSVLIFGDGPIGLILLMMLQDRSRNIVVVGGRDERLKLAGQLGATKTLNYHAFSEKFSDEIRREMEGPVPTIIESSGSSAALSCAFDLVSQGGRILELGDYGSARADFQWNQVLHREITLIGSNASAGAWSQAVRIAVEDNLPLHRLVTHRLPAAKFQDGLECVRNRAHQAIKVVLEWDCTC